MCVSKETCVVVARVAKGWKISQNPWNPCEKSGKFFQNFLEYFRNLLEDFHLFATLVVASSGDLLMMKLRWKRWLRSLEYADYFPRTLVSAVIKGELTRKDDILALLIR